MPLRAAPVERIRDRRLAQTRQVVSPFQRKHAPTPPHNSSASALTPRAQTPVRPGAEAESPRAGRASARRTRCPGGHQDDVRRESIGSSPAVPAAVLVNPLSCRCRSTVSPSSRTCPRAVRIRLADAGGSGTLIVAPTPSPSPASDIFPVHRVAVGSFRPRAVDTKRTDALSSSAPITTVSPSLLLKLQPASSRSRSCRACLARGPPCGARQSRRSSPAPSRARVARAVSPRRRGDRAEEAESHRGLGRRVVTGRSAQSKCRGRESARTTSDVSR